MGCNKKKEMNTNLRTYIFAVTSEFATTFIISGLQRTFFNGSPVFAKVRDFVKFKDITNSRGSPSER